MDTKNKKIILLSHCILNSYSKVEYFYENEGIFKEVFQNLMKKNYGIIQLPCPENLYLGVNRWSMSREQYDSKIYREHCINLINPVLNEVSNYINNGYEIKYVIGVKGSPSCGITKSRSSDNYGGEIINEKDYYSCKFISKMGIFMEEFFRLSREREINLFFVELDENEPNYLLSLL
ncbi:MAG: hypothetical protein FWC47_15830 [Oscillospiraceae bacterium]|nr:hypothetical protein [Oscillospiraceae bacterium]